MPPPLLELMTDIMLNFLCCAGMGDPPEVATTTTPDFPRTPLGGAIIVYY